MIQAKTTNILLLSCNYIFAMLFCLAIFSCKSSLNDIAKVNLTVSDSLAQNEPIVVDYSKLPLKKGSYLNLSNIAESISYTTLSNDVLLGDTKTMSTYVVNEDVMIIYYGMMAYKFNINTGAYLGAVYSKGRASNESVAPERPTIDRANNVLISSDMGTQTFKKFNINKKGDLLDRSAKDYGKKFYIGYLDNYEVTHSTFRKNGNRNPYGENLLDVRDTKSGELVYSYPNPYHGFEFKPTGGNSSIELSAKVFIGKLSDNSYWFNFKNIDTLYTTTDFRRVKPYIVIKPTEPRLSFTDIIKQDNGAFDKYKITHSRIGQLALSDRFLFVGAYSTSYYHVVYDIKKKTTKLFDRTVRNDIDSVADIDLCYALNFDQIIDNKLYILIDALKIFDNNKQDKFPGLKEDSNPVLMIVTLKK